MVDIGYDQFNALLLLQTMSIGLLLYFVQVLVFFIILLLHNRLKDRFQFLGKIYNKLKRIFFNPLIELLIQGYFEFLISILLIVKQSESFQVEVLSMTIISISAILCLAVLPIALVYMISRLTEQLLQQNTIERVSSLYSNLNLVYNIHDMFARAYFLLFAFRRIIYVAIAWLLSSIPMIQIILLTHMQ